MSQYPCAGRGLGDLVERIRRTKRLTPVEETALIARWKGGDDTARGRIIEKHLPIALKLAMSRTRGRPPFEDALAEATAGLIVGIDHYDPTRGVRISHVAEIWARDAIDDFMLANASLVRIPNTTLTHKLHAVACRIPSHSNNRFQPDMAAVTKTAATVRCEVDELVSIWVSRQPHGTLDDERFAYAPDQTGTDEDRLIEADLARKRATLVRESIGRLPEREADMFASRHLRETPEPYRDVARRHVISEERARQINQKTLETVKRMIAETDSP